MCQVSPMSPAMYRAVHLSVPSVIAQFRTVYRDAEGAEVDSRTYNVDLNTGTTIDWDVSVQVSSPGPAPCTVLSCTILYCTELYYTVL